jgi:hypothetical protein
MKLKHIYELQNVYEITVTVKHEFFDLILLLCIIYLFKFFKHLLYLYPDW